MEAVREIRILNLRKRIRYEYRMWLKAKRDRMAEDAYVRDEGRAEGIAIGTTRGKATVVRNMLAQEMELSQICQVAECDEAFVEKVRREQM